MCSWERFCTFAREPERRKVGVDARVSLDGVSYEVDPDMAGEEVVLWWGIFDNELYVERGDQRYGPYTPMDGDELGDILGEDDIPDAGEWHDAVVGSAYFSRLAALVSQQPDADRHRALIAELTEFSTVLDQAQAVGARWRLAIDL